MKNIVKIFVLVALLFPATGRAANIATQVSGRILLQVQSHGEAWYVNPATHSRYYLKDGLSAYQIMSKLGLGISNENLAKIPIGVNEMLQVKKNLDTDNDGLDDKTEESVGTDPVVPDTDNDGYSDAVEVIAGYNPLGGGRLSSDRGLISQLKGKILLQVQKQGQAWYLNPIDGKRYFLQNGEVAYQVMRYLGLGVTNANLEMIPVSQANDASTIIRNCGEDFDCFIESSKTCQPAEVSFTMNFTFLLPMTSNSLFEIRGLEQNKCIFYQKLGKTTLSFPAGTSQSIIDYNNQVYQRMEGLDKICQFDTHNLVEGLTRWKLGNFDSWEVTCDLQSCSTKGGDFGSAECSGKLVDPPSDLFDGLNPPAGT